MSYHSFLKNGSPAFFFPPFLPPLVKRLFFPTAMTRKLATRGNSMIFWAEKSRDQTACSNNRKCCPTAFAKKKIDKKTAGTAPPTQPSPFFPKKNWNQSAPSGLFVSRNWNQKKPRKPTASEAEKGSQFEKRKNKTSTFSTANFWVQNARSARFLGGVKECHEVLQWLQLPSDVFLSLSIWPWEVGRFSKFIPGHSETPPTHRKALCWHVSTTGSNENFHHPLLKKLKFRLRLVAHISSKNSCFSKGSNCITRSWRFPCGLNDPMNYGHLFAKSITLQATAPQRGPWMATSATLPSRELTCPTWGKGKSSSKVPSDGMLISKRVVSGFFSGYHHILIISYHFLSFFTNAIRLPFHCHILLTNETPHLNNLPQSKFHTTNLATHQNLTYLTRWERMKVLNRCICIDLISAACLAGGETRPWMDVSKHPLIPTYVAFFVHHRIQEFLIEICKSVDFFVRKKIRRFGSCFMQPPCDGDVIFFSFQDVARWLANIIDTHLFASAPGHAVDACPTECIKTAMQNPWFLGPTFDCPNSSRAYCDDIFHNIVWHGKVSILTYFTQ